MPFRSTMRVFTLAAALLVFGGMSYAQGNCSNCSNLESNLTVNATAQTAIMLTISTHASGAAVTDGGSGAFSLSFGNVNGLGVGSLASNVSVSTSASGATYTTPITVTPSFSGFTDATATVLVYQDPNAAAASQSAAREGSAAESVSQPAASSGSASTVTASASSGSALTRYVGVFVSNANGGSKVIGALAPKFIYKVTVP